MVGVVGAFPPGETCHGTYDLEPGSYLLVCNLVDRMVEHDGRAHDHVHLDLGMWTYFAVA